MSDSKKSSWRISSKRISDLKVVVLCIAAATTFWILNALNKDNYSTIVDYPISWEFDRESFIPVKPLPKSVQIQISGNGWDLLRKYFNLNEPPFLINLADPDGKQFLLTSDLKRPLGEFLTPTQLEGLLEDSIRYQIDRIVTREFVPLLDSTSYSLAPNSEIEGDLEFTPKSIKVTGPISVLESFGSTYPVSLNKAKLGEDFTETVSLSIPEQWEEIMSLETGEITISGKIIHFLEGNKRLKIKKVNFPRTVQIQPEDVTPIATYLVDERKVSELKDLEFEAVLDYGKRNRSDSTITFEISPKPSFLRDISISPPLIKLRYD